MQAAFLDCSQTQFITKQKEIDVKSVYINRGSGEVGVLPGFHTFSGADIMGFYLSNRKKNAGNFSKRKQSYQ